MFEKNKLEADVKRIKEQIGFLDKTIDAQSLQNDLATLENKKMLIEDELKVLALYRDALDLTSELLKKAQDELYSEVGPYINEFVNKYFKCLSSDYETVEVNSNLEIDLKPVEFPQTINVENVGKGMQTSLYLLLRMAIISLFKVNKNDSLPFILDETFNVLDDFSENRQKKFLELLLGVCKDYNLQAIYFTCQKFGQFIPIKKFLEKHSYLIREEHVEDFTILHGGRDESELSISN